MIQLYERNKIRYGTVMYGMVYGIVHGMVYGMIDGMVCGMYGIV